MRGTTKSGEGCTSLEKGPQVEISKPDPSDDNVGCDKIHDVQTPPRSVPEVATTARQPTRFSTRIVKRPRRDLSPPDSPVKKSNENKHLKDLK